MVKIKNKLEKINLIFSVSILLAACVDRNDGAISTKGQSTFIKVINQEVKFALLGTIKKEPGFNSNCSVDKETEDGILITRGVCDNDKSFSIRVTNTSGYPPSKRLKFIKLNFSGTKVELLPGEIKEIADPNGNKISIELSKTVSSFFIEGTRL